MSVDESSRDRSVRPATGELFRLVLARMVQAEADEFDQPHIVLVSSPQFTTYEGPYPDALSALLAAADEEAALEAEDELSFSIAPLWAPQRIG